MDTKSAICSTLISDLEIDVLNPTPGVFYKVDIAESLSKLARYNGHSHFPWSVASHVLLGLIILKDHYRSHPDIKLIVKQWCLHDATEAYLGDMIKPVKVHIEEFNQIEENLWAKGIAPQYNLPAEFHPIVKDVDYLCLIEEMEVLTKRKVPEEKLLKKYSHLQNYKPRYRHLIDEIPWRQAKDTYLEALDKFV